jgi:hypothetical protein
MRSLLPLTTKAALAAITLVVTVGGAGGALAVAGLGGESSGAAEAGHAAVPLDARPPVTQSTPETTVPPPPTTVPLPVTTTPTTNPAASGSRTARPPAPTTTVAAASPSTATRTASAQAPLPPGGVARRAPSSTEVQEALKIFPQYVKTFIKPTSAQVAELGDRVCTAFDEGQTFAQVKATGLGMVTQVPKTTVLPGGADWVVRTIVNLYCPGHAPKLV